MKKTLFAIQIPTINNKQPNIGNKIIVQSGKSFVSSSFSAEDDDFDDDDDCVDDNDVAESKPIDTVPSEMFLELEDEVF